MLIRSILTLVITTVCIVSIVGCLEDDLLDIYKESSSDSESDSAETVDRKSLTKLKEGSVLNGNYSEWVDGDDGFAPGEVQSLVNDESHAGYNMARCFDCHGEGMPYPPEDHDVRMQYWAWSCSRGFPGSTCHGHGTNGAPAFNHDGDPAFSGCTQKLCHFKFEDDVRYENHGFNNAPDAFCNACHDYYWKDWPDGIEIETPGSN